MSYTYATFVATIASLARIENPSTNVAYQNFIPTLIDQAESRINQDLDLLATIVTDTSGTTLANSREFALPQTFVVLEEVNIINSNIRSSLTKYSRVALNFLWPNNASISASDIPVSWAPLTDDTILLGPCPGTTFQVECIGTIRPTPLSPSNTSTFISTQLSNLFLAAGMLITTAYQQNFGAQADDPRTGLTWQQTYDQLKASINVEELRRKFQGFYGPGGM